LPSFRQGWAEVFIHRVQVSGNNVCYAERSVKMGKRERKEGVGILPATDLTAAYARKGYSDQRESRGECYVEARQRVQGRKEWQSSRSDGKGVEGKASKKGR